MPDLEQARADLEPFAAMVGCPLERWQAHALELASRVTVIVAPRQSGKSRSLAVLALWSAFRRREQRVLLVSAGEEASRRLLAEVRRIATGSSLLAGSVVDELAGLLTLSNGSEVRSVPASERAVRGWAVDLLLVDEAAMVPDDLLLGAAFPTTAARPDARIVLASSATVAAGAFFDHAVRGEQGSEHVRTHRWALVDAHWISPSTIEAARESMSPTRFAAEYEGVFASGADALFSRQTLDRVTADYRIDELEELRGPARLAAGVDWGAVNDRSTLVALARLPTGGARVFGVVCAKRWRAGEPLTNVISQIATAQAHYGQITMERNGLGEPCCQELIRLLRERPHDAGGGFPQRMVVVDAHAFEASLEARPRRRPVVEAPAPPTTFATTKNPVHTTAEMKAATYSGLRLLIDQERLVLPTSAQDLIRELLMLRVDLSPSGLERIEASSGHDDLADAMALSLTPYRDRGGRWRSDLADLADPRKRLPEAVLPPEARNVATVATGGGLRIPRTPVLQSVAGSELTVPAGLEVRDRDPRLERLRERVAEEITHHNQEVSDGE